MSWAFLDGFSILNMHHIFFSDHCGFKQIRAILIYFPVPAFVVFNSDSIHEKVYVPSGMVIFFGLEFSISFKSISIKPCGNKKKREQDFLKSCSRSSEFIMFLLL